MGPHEVLLGRVDERTLEYLKLLLRGEANTGNGQFLITIRGRRIIGMQALTRIVGQGAAFPGKDMLLCGNELPYREHE